MARRRLTRRTWLWGVAAAGGSAIAGLAALGLLDEEPSPPPLMPATSPKRVVVLGAGLAGMSAAYELTKLGHEVIVLEAQERPGGRCRTLRAGDTIIETDGTSQVAAFAAGQYFNPGPARIPHHHTVTLDYCRELGVAVEPFINSNEAALLYRRPGRGPLSGQPVRAGAVRADLRGYASELLAKSSRRDLLDRPLSTADTERLLEWLRREGGLTPDLVYRGSSRRGYRQPPGAGDAAGEVAAPYELSALLQAGFAERLGFADDIDQQATMLQIQGGTDRLALAFADRLSGRIRYGAVVQEIRRDGTGARVIYRLDGGMPEEERADVCICTIPLPVLRGIAADFSPQLQAAVAGVSYAPAVKIGLQFSRRFWEEDQHIYGGISWTDTPITQIWYPSHGFLSERGVLVGAYAYEGDARMFGRLAPDARVARALAEGGDLHAGYAAGFETGVSVPWQNLRYALGAWASYSAATRAQHYPTLIAPDGPFLLAGEHTSHLTGWMAGALAAGRRAAALVSERLR